MPRVKPTKRIDVIGSLDLRPELAVSDYFASKRNESFFVLPPEADSAGDSIEMLFINNSREHDAMLKLQKEMLESSKHQSTINKERVQKMFTTQDYLRKRFIEVNNFIKDCDDKKHIAQKVVNTEATLHEELSKDIVGFKSSINELKSFREALKATVQEFKPFEKILDDVVESSDIFVSPKDCMDRCDALMLAQVEIHRLEQQKVKEIAEMRQRMIIITNDAALTVLGLKTDLVKLERACSESRNLCFEWEKILANTKNVIATNYMEKERTLDAVNALYRLICRRRDIEPEFLRQDVEAQFDFVKREIELLDSIFKEYDSNGGNERKKSAYNKSSGANY